MRSQPRTDVKVCARPSEVRCPLCLSPLAGDMVRACDRCRTATHQECSEELAASCPTSGCAPRGAARITVRVRPATPSSALATVLQVLAVGGVVLITFVGLLVAAWPHEAPGPYEGPTTKVDQDIWDKGR